MNNYLIYFLACFLEVQLRTTRSARLSIGWLVGQSVGWMVCHNFLKGQPLRVCSIYLHKYYLYLYGFSHPIFDVCDVAPTGRAGEPLRVPRAQLQDHPGPRAQAARAGERHQVCNHL